MAEDKAARPAKQAEPAPAPVLGAAGESSSPLVHQLLAERETAISNGDTAAAEELTARLAELGVK